MTCLKFIPIKLLWIYILFTLIFLIEPIKRNVESTLVYWVVEYKNRIEKNKHQSVKHIGCTLIINQIHVIKITFR